MLKLRKNKANADAYTAPLHLGLADGALGRTFSPEVVTSYRQMVTELVYAGKLPQRIAVAGALQGEGVTYSALALGTILASDTAARVCIVDLNWWRPGMITSLDPAIFIQPKRRRRKDPAPTPTPVALELSAAPGLAQVADGEAALDDALLATSLPRLQLLPAGACALERRPALARSTALRAVVDELCTRYDHLIFDVPSVLGTSDAIALASLGEAACVVVRHGVTSTVNVQHTLDALKHLQILGVVLNQVSIRTPRWILSLIPQE